MGGDYTEGLIGSPRFLNPILSPASDVDRDISQMIFSSLMKYNGASLDSEAALPAGANLVNDLVENYTISSDGKIYEARLKKRVKWHDGAPFNADDVLFTIQLIQNADYKSPLRINWLGIETEKIDDYAIRFKLKNAYAPFLHNLTFGILPKHIWKDISPANFSLSAYNLKPIGTGPYKFKSIKKDKKTSAVTLLELASYKDYHFSSGQNACGKNCGKTDQPNLKTVKFKFYKNEEDILAALNKKEIDGFGFFSAKNFSRIKFPEIFNTHLINLPRYFAIFFNQENNKVLADKNVRLALTYAVNKQEIIDKVLNGKGLAVNSPILPDLFGYQSLIEKKYPVFDLENAKALLEKNNWRDEDGDGWREKTTETTVNRKTTKETQKLKFTLLTTQRSELTDTANLLKEQWQKIGADVTIETKEIFDLQQNHIKPREYQALLFGEVLSIDPDPFAFWHSSQKRDPGLNLALFDNREADKLLEGARQEVNKDKRVQQYIKFQNLVVDETPVIFLYSPYYIYLVDKKIKNIDAKLVATPANRFNQVEKWHIKTKRQWK